jgi:predicted DCC family thiol-disulfide oxidoreductase YuxK
VSAATESAVLLYDGSCGFCARSVQFVLSHERDRRTLRFASLQGPVGREVAGRWPQLANVDSMIWYLPAGGTRPERVLVRSDAVLAIAQYLGGVWRVLGGLGHIMPRSLRDAAYDAVAARRHRITPKACLLPSADERSRFMDPEFAPRSFTPLERQ